MLLLVFSTRCFLQIFIITRTNGDTSHFARVGIFNSGLLMTNFSLWQLILRSTCFQEIWNREEIWKCLHSKFWTSIHTVQWNLCIADTIGTRVREGGEATRYFCIIGTVIRWLLLLLLIWILTWLAAIGRADNCFYRLQLWFVINILQNKIQCDPRSLKKRICSQFTFRSSCHVNIAFWILQSDIQSKTVWSTTKDFSLGCFWQLAENW